MTDVSYCFTYSIPEGLARKLRSCSGLVNGFAPTVEELSAALRSVISFNDVVELIANEEGGCLWAAILPIQKVEGGSSQVVGHSVLFYIPSPTIKRNLDFPFMIFNSVELGLLFSHEMFASWEHHTLLHDVGDTRHMRLLVRTEALKLASGIFCKTQDANTPSNIFSGSYNHGKLNPLQLEPPGEHIEAAFDNVRTVKEYSKMISETIFKSFKDSFGM